MIIEKDGSGNTTVSYTRGLSLGGGIGSIISKHEGNKDYYYIYDAQGNVTHLTDSSGKVIMRYEYDAFGNIVYQSGSLTQSYQYQTKEYDSQSGLVYFGARYYDSAIGRFTTPDPLGIIDGPNRYVYLSNDPINLMDPWGLCGGKLDIDLAGMNPALVAGIAGGVILSEEAIPFIIIAGVGYTIYQNREALSETILMNSPATTLVTLIYYTRGPRPEPYPGYDKGKRVGERGKNYPKPAPDSHNPTPDPIPPKGWWAELLEKIADLLGEMQD